MLSPLYVFLPNIASHVPPRDHLIRFLPHPNFGPPVNINNALALTSAIRSSHSKVTVAVLVNVSETRQREPEPFLGLLPVTDVPAPEFVLK